MSPRRPPGLRVRAAAVACALLAISACGGGGSDADTGVAAGESAAADLAERATAGDQARYTATYALETGSGEDSTATVVREPLRVRLDVRTAQGVATSIRDADGIVSCQRSRDDRTTCLVVAGPGEEADQAFDPSLRRVFGEVLRVFAERSGELDVERVTPEVDVPAAGPDADLACFRVGGDPPEPVSAGTYCLTSAGVPAWIGYPASTATLTALSGPPGPDAFDPPASPQPVPRG